MRRWRCGMFALCAAILGTAAPAWAQAEIGRAEKIVNQVFGGGLLYRLQPDARLKASERVDTGPNSAALLRFDDGSTLALNADAQVTLDGMVYDRAKGLSGELALIQGALKFAGGPGPKRLSFSGPALHAGVRGTVFVMLVKQGATEIEVQQGQVDATVGGTVIALKAGDWLRAAPGQAPIRGVAPASFRSVVSALDQSLGLRSAAPAASGSGGLAGAPGEVRPYRSVTSGLLLGHLRFREGGRIDLLDPNMTLMGWCDGRPPRTYDSVGRPVTEGCRPEARLGR